MNSLLHITLEVGKYLAAMLPVAAVIYVTMRMILRRHAELMERSHYDDLRQEAVLSEMRASYESKISELAREMVATRARWEDANHLLISGQSRQQDLAASSAVDPTGFLKSFGISPRDASVQEDLVFVLTPFAQEERSVFEAIKRVCDRTGLIARRGDETRAEGDILQQIISGIVASRLVIANISARNPNVFFELGIAMALGKPTLLISSTLDDTPFDVRGRRILIYNDEHDLERRLAEALLQTINAPKKNA
jgi:hypothetical protein